MSTEENKAQHRVHPTEKELILCLSISCIMSIISFPPTSGYRKPLGGLQHHSVCRLSALRIPHQLKHRRRTWKRNR